MLGRRREERYRVKVPCAGTVDVPRSLEAGGEADASDAWVWSDGPEVPGTRALLSSGADAQTEAVRVASCIPGVVDGNVRYLMRLVRCEPHDEGAC
jgi:hypothetical protein